GRAVVVRRAAVARPVVEEGAAPHELREEREAEQRALHSHVLMSTVAPGADRTPTNHAPEPTSAPGAGVAGSFGPNCSNSSLTYSSIRLHDWSNALTGTVKRSSRSRGFIDA